MSGLGVLKVLDIDGRAIVLLSDAFYDAGKAHLAEEWSAHLTDHDEARAAVAELIEAAEGVERMCGRDGLWAGGEPVSARLHDALARVKGGGA